MLNAGEQFLLAYMEGMRMWADALRTSTYTLTVGNKFKKTQNMDHRKHRVITLNHTGEVERNSCKII